MELTYESAAMEATTERCRSMILTKELAMTEADLFTSWAHLEEMQSLALKLQEQQQTIEQLRAEAHDQKGRAREGTKRAYVRQGSRVEATARRSLLS